MKYVVFFFFALMIPCSVFGQNEVSSNIDQVDQASLDKLQRIRTQMSDISTPLAESPLPSNEQEESSVVTRMFQGLALSLGLFFVLCYFMKGKQSSQGKFQEKRLSMVEKISVGPKMTAAILSVDDREILIGMSEQGISLLQALPSNKSSGKRRQPISLNDKQVVRCINE